MDLMPLSALFLQSIPEVIIMLMTGSVLSGIDLSNHLRKLIIIGILYGLSSYFIRALPLPFGVHTLLQLPLLMLMLRYILKISLKQGTLVVMLGTIIQILIEGIYVPLISLLIDKPITVIIKDPLLRILVPWPYMLIMLIISFYFKKRGITIFPLINLLGAKIFNVRYSLIALVLVQAILLGLINAYLLLGNIGHLNDAHSLITVHMLSVIILLSLFLSLFLVRNLLTSVKKELSAESQSLFQKNVNDLFISLRAQRHDFINHVHTLNGLLSMNDYAMAKAYVRKLVQDTVQLNDVIRLREPFLAALLRSKLAYADSKGIRFTVHSDATLEQSNLNCFELTRIIGNLVDNALEAVENLSPEERWVEIAIKKYTGFYIFEVTNGGPPIPEERLKVIFNPEFTTKEGHSGLGLSIVKQLVEKAKGTLGVKSQPGATVFTVTLPAG